MTISKFLRGAIFSAAAIGLLSCTSSTPAYAISTSQVSGEVCAPGSITEPQAADYLFGLSEGTTVYKLDTIQEPEQAEILSGVLAKIGLGGLPKGTVIVYLAIVPESQAIAIAAYGPNGCGKSVAIPLAIFAPLIAPYESVFAPTQIARPEVIPGRDA